MPEMPDNHNQCALVQVALIACTNINSHMNHGDILLYFLLELILFNK